MLSFASWTPISQYMGPRKSFKVQAVACSVLLWPPSSSCVQSHLQESFSLNSRSIAQNPSYGFFCQDLKLYMGPYGQEARAAPAVHLNSAGEEELSRFPLTGPVRRKGFVPRMRGEVLVSECLRCACNLSRRLRLGRQERSVVEQALEFTLPLRDQKLCHLSS